MGDLATLNRTLDQELMALLRGASLECLVCGEFVMRVKAVTVCPDCRTLVYRTGAAVGVDAILEEVEARAT